MVVKTKHLVFKTNWQIQSAVNDLLKVHKQSKCAQTHTDITVLTFALNISLALSGYHNITRIKNTPYREKTISIWLCLVQDCIYNKIGGKSWEWDFPFCLAMKYSSSVLSCTWSCITLAFSIYKYTINPPWPDSDWGKTRTLITGVKPVTGN